jgi:hypothetical protein
VAGVTEVVKTDGWTTYQPARDKLVTDGLAGAMDAYVYDCRLFARLAREAKWQELPAKLDLTWEQFCEQRLGQPVGVVDAVVAGVEVLGEKLPVPATVAERVGKKFLDHRKAGPGRGKKTLGPSKCFASGSGKRYWLGRLERDRPELAAQVRRGDLKAKTAARQAGIIKTKTPLEHLQHWWAKASNAERRDFLRGVRES